MNRDLPNSQGQNMVLGSPPDFAGRLWAQAAIAQAECGGPPTPSIDPVAPPLSADCGGLSVMWSCPSPLIGCKGCQSCSPALTTNWSWSGQAATLHLMPEIVGYSGRVISVVLELQRWNFKPCSGFRKKSNPTHMAVHGGCLAFWAGE